MDKLKRYVVIDKSYLQGAKPDEVRLLCERGALMVDALYTELLTTKPEARRCCFMKFPTDINPVVYMMPTMGALLQHEMNTHSRCTPLIDWSLYARFEFQEGLADGTYGFTESDSQVDGDIKCEMQEHMNGFRMASAKMESWFPEICGFRANGPSVPIDAAMKRVATDQECVRSIYSGIAEEMQPLLDSGSGPPKSGFSPPDPTAINKNWMYFRFLQVLLVEALEFVRKNGSGDPGRNSVSLEHDLFDVEYVTMGVLAGALASRDKKIKRFFRLLCPDGELIC